jgi:proline iminopeptidase
MKFGSAYFYRMLRLEIVRGMLMGPHTVYRPEALIFGYSHLLNGWTVMDRLHEIQTPTLVLAGRYDFLFPPEHQAILADRLPNAQLELIECAGHNPHMEQPAETMQAIRDFMAIAQPEAQAVLEPQAQLELEEARI